MTLEEQLGYFFFDKSHLKRALTRRTYALEAENQAGDDQDAYVLLGGAVLDAVLTELLIREGHTTQGAIVGKKLDLKQIERLAGISDRLGVGFVVKLGKAEKERRAYEDPILLTETLEAVFGAIYFDGGFSAARRVIARLFQDAIAIEE